MWNEKFRNSAIFNPPEAIPLSDRLGHFFSVRFLTRFARGHTTVSQTGFFSFFLKVIFGLSEPYHGLTDWVCGMVTDILGQKSDLKKKIPVCETMV